MAQPNMFGVTEFDQDPETAAELMRIRRQQQIADAMMQSGRAAPQGRMAGRIFVPSSPLEGLGALAEQYVAKGQMGEAEQGYKNLAESRRIMQDNEIGKIVEVMQGRKEQPMGPPTPTGEMGVREAVPAGTRDDVALAMMASKLPDYKKAGFQMYVTGGEKKESREDALAQRKFELEENHKNRMMQLQVAKASDAEKAREQRSHQEQMVRLAASLKPPRDEGAPVAVTGPDGKPMYVSKKDAIGKTPAAMDAKAQAIAQRQADGSTDVDVALGTLRDAYNRLETGGGITSTGKGAMDNAGASLSSSGIGQGIGKIFGTKNQSARNDVAMARPALLAALMKATGMSSKQMDSNAELKLWLSTATDPTLDVESNRKALDNIEKKYLKSGAAKPASAGGSSGEWKDL